MKLVSWQKNKFMILIKTNIFIFKIFYERWKTLQIFVPSSSVSYQAMFTKLFNIRLDRSWFLKSQIIIMGPKCFLFYYNSTAMWFLYDGSRWRKPMIMQLKLHLLKLHRTHVTIHFCKIRFYRIQSYGWLNLMVW